MRCELCWERAGRQTPAMFAVSWRDVNEADDPCINMVLCDLCAEEIDGDEAGMRELNAAMDRIRAEKA